MSWLIEDEEQLKWFQTQKYEEAFIEVIPYNYKTHPVENQITLLYVFPLGSNKGYIVNIDHSEALYIENTTYTSIIDTFKTVYVRDKKESLHYFIHPNIIDLTLNLPDYIPEEPKVFEYFHKLYSEKEDVNRIIPIVKHYEYCNRIFKKLKPQINVPYNEFYNNKFSLVFNYLERSGIQVDKEQFEERFHKTPSNRVFTQYNFKTTTGRPSNKYNGVNYAALNKKDGTRKMFIPSNDVLVEIDIKAHHLVLLAKLLEYDFENQNIHQHFADLYGVEYGEGKKISFKMLYSGNFGEYSHIPFFKKAHEYTGDLWRTFQTQGYIECPISKHRFVKDKLPKMNPAKLLNYLLQNLEASNSVRILWEIIGLLKGKKTKLILYTYDSFLFDFVEEEAKDLYKEIKKVFTKRKFTTTTVYGRNYDFAGVS